MRKLNAKKSLILALMCLLAVSKARAVSPQITITATGLTLLGTAAPISIICTLIDPGKTGTLRISGGGTLVNFRASTVTPANTASVGPVWGQDAVLNGLGVANSTFYLVQVFVQNSGGFLSTTPSFQQFYAFNGSGTFDLVTATPILPNSFNTPTGVSIPGTLTAGSFSASQLVSTVATGTPPLVVASTTQVANLNVSQLGGFNPPGSAIDGINDANALTNHTFDISANTLKNSTNTVGHFPRNNGTKYADSTIQPTDVPVFVASGASHAPGAVPDPGSSAGTTRFLREDATFAVPSASGGVTTVYNTTASAAAATIGSTAMVTAPASDTNYTFGASLAQTGATSGCSTQPSFQIEIVYTDAFTGSSRTVLPLVNQLGNSGTFNNGQSFAGALSAATTYSTHVSLRAKASTTVSYTVVYAVGIGCGTGASYSVAPVLVQD